MTTLVPKYNQGATGAVNRPFNLKLAEQVSVKDFGAVGDGVTNNTTAIQAAIDYVSSVGGSLFFPAGTYLHTATLVFKNNVVYFGEGQGSVLRYTGTSDQIQVNNPINSSTAANIVVRDLYLLSTIATAGKANFADVGSTYLTISNVYFSCNSFGLILDQSELVVVERCNFSFNVAGCTAGIWIVNGPGHTVGALTSYTNRLTIRNNQFNGASGFGIINDGGIAHAIENNNFNALGTQIRLAECNNISIANNEFEAADTTVILVANTYYAGGGGASGASNVISIRNNLLTVDGTYAVTFTSSCCFNLDYSNNTFNIPAGAQAPDNNPSTFVNNIIASNNYNYVGGTQPYNNLGVNGGYTPVVGGSATLGAGTYTVQQGAYQLNGTICTFQTNITWTAHTGSGLQLWASIPISVLSSTNSIIPVTVVSSGITVAAGAQIVGYIVNTGTVFGAVLGYIQLYTLNAGTLAVLAIPASGSLYITGQYTAR